MFILTTVRAVVTYSNKAMKKESAHEGSNREAHKKDSSTSDGLFSEENLNRIIETVRNTPGGPLKKCSVFLSELLHIRKTPANLELAEKTMEEPSAENMAELMNHSPMIGDNARKRKLKKEK